ncbi:hypothetical protein J1614_008680 [Plenodomus biglobosus]|nr:hypothetical protein J1614_008680 [Plenodomus biglobosus]
MKMHHDQMARGQPAGSMPSVARDSRELLSYFAPPPQRLASSPATYVQRPYCQYPDTMMSSLHESQQQGHWKLSERLQTSRDIYKLRRNMQGPMPSSADIIPDDVKYTRLVLSQQQRMLTKTITEWPAIHTRPETSVYAQHQGMLPAVYRPSTGNFQPHQCLDPLPGLSSIQRIPPTLAHLPPLQDTQQLSPLAANAQEQPSSFTAIPGLGAHILGSSGSQQVSWDITPTISTTRTQKQESSPFARSSVAAKAQDNPLQLAHTLFAPNAQTSFARPSVVTNTDQCAHEFEFLANHQGWGGRERAFADGRGMEDEKKKEQPEEHIPDK